MHKFMSAIGFEACKTKKDLDKLLEELVHKQTEFTSIQIERESDFCEIRTEVAPNMGIAMFGEMGENEVFRLEYYYPYLKATGASSKAECTIQRHTEKETYAGLLDECRVGISLIFYLQNAIEFQKRVLKKESLKVDSVTLSGLSVDGKILLPIQKTEKQKQSARFANQDRNNLIEAAKNGDEDAIETLTIEDIDLYSKISRRVLREDIYTIIDSCFMPCGIECDQYAIIGEITEMERNVNQISKEEVYNLTIDCNDMTFHVGINSKNLLGVPEVGRRFKGQIWMQGIAHFETETPTV